MFRRLAIAFGISILVALTSWPMLALAYNCGGAEDGSPDAPSAGHCYMVTGWRGGTQGASVWFQGAAYDNDPTCSDKPEACFLNREEWLQFSGSNTWIEAGMKANQGTYEYFWAERGPQSPYFERHVNQGESLGDYTWIYLSVNGPFKLHVHMFSPDINFHFDRDSNITGLNSPNGPNLVFIGDELAGSQSAIDPEGEWDNSQWYDSGNTPHYQNTPLPYSDETPNVLEAPFTGVFFDVPSNYNYIPGGAFGSYCWSFIWGDFCQ